MFKCLALVFVFVALTVSHLRGWRKHKKMSLNIEERLNKVDEDIQGFKNDVIEFKDILKTIVNTLNQNQEGKFQQFM